VKGKVGMGVKKTDTAVGKKLHLRRGAGRMEEGDSQSTFGKTCSTTKWEKIPRDKEVQQGTCQKRHDTLRVGMEKTTEISELASIEALNLLNLDEIHEEKRAHFMRKHTEPYADQKLPEEKREEEKAKLRNPKAERIQDKFGEPS